VVQVQEPLFRKRQVFTKDCPGDRRVLSGMVTSLTKDARSTQPSSVGGGGWADSGAGTDSVCVSVSVAVGVGAEGWVAAGLPGIRSLAKAPSPVAGDQAVTCTYGRLSHGAPEGRTNEQS